MRLQFNLRSKIWILIGCLSIFTGTVVFTFSYFYLQAIVENNLQKTAESITHAIEVNVQYAVGDDVLQQIVYNLSKTSANPYIIIVRNKKITQSSEPQLIGLNLQSLNDPNILRRLDRAKTYNRVFWQHDENSHHIWFSKPLTTLNINTPNAILYFELDNRWDMMSLAGLLQPLHWIISAVLFAILILSLLWTLEVLIFRPIQDLHKYARSYGNDASGEGELADINFHIQYMEQLLSKQGIHVKALEHQVSAAEEGLEKRVKDRTVTLEHGMEEAQVINELKSELIASVSRQIRAPMCDMVECSEQLLDTSLGKSQLSLVKQLQSYGSNLLSVLDDVLDYTKLESNQLILQREQFSLRTQVGEVLGKFQALSDHKDLRLHCEIGEDVPASFIGDSSRVAQILYSLMDLAVTLTERGSISVYVSALSRHERQCNVMLRITDTGKGLSKEQIEQLFEPVNNELLASLPRGESGLALTLTYRLVKLMSGDIQVSGSHSMGMSYNVTVQLEVLEPTGAEENHESEGMKRVLLALDNIVNQTIAQQALTEQGYAVSVIGNMMDDISELLDSRHYEVLLVDTALIHSTGKDLWKQYINDKLTKTLVVALADQDDQIHGITDCVHRIIHKPFTKEELIQAFQEMNA